MTEEDKNLLLIDLSGRLSYGVKVQFSYITTSPAILKGIDEELIICDIAVCELEDVKPFLFPLSSMTEKQCNEFYCKFVENEIDYNDFKEYYFEGGLWHKLLTSIDDCDSVVNWFNKNHFDYRGLIEKGLALEARKGMYN